ncbi:MAG: Rne/Rng family ribonuclease [Microcoleaceae cyanobacterium]
MPKQIIIAEQHRIAAVFAEDQIQEMVVSTGQHQVSDVYLGIVENVLPGIDAAFINIGDPDRNGFIHIGDLGPLRLKRSSASITELLTPQQKVLVQIMKEPTGNKGPRLTGNISLPGRYLVLLPFGKGVNLSRRISSESERNRLRALAILTKPAGMGLLVRTEADGVEEDAILEDLETLQKQWESIQIEGSSVRAPALLNRDNDFIQKVLRDMYSSEVNRIVVDSQQGVKRVKQHLANWNGGKAPQVFIDHHRERIPILEFFRVNAAIREALRPRVDLPSGGYVIIQPTEALTVIDVNSGSFTKSATARETVLWTNCEAATEIARQLRLRNIAGVIVVDFIDMDTRRDQLQVLEHFNKVLRSDKARPQISQLSELGLVELTRKRQGQNIYELFGCACTTCGGLGHLVNLPGGIDTPEPLIGNFSDTFLNIRLNSPNSLPTLDLGDNLRPVPRQRQERADIYGYDPGLENSRDARLDVAQANSPKELYGEAETISNDNNLDLINHPSYQEVNRRRRRRRNGTEIAGKENNQWNEVEKENDWEVGELETPLDKRATVFNPLAAVGGMNTSNLSTLRGRNNRELARAMPEPLELITVEMTPDEQDIYALMGISPAVLLGQDVLNMSKNFTVVVTEPGQSEGVQSRQQRTSVMVEEDEDDENYLAEGLDQVEDDDMEDEDHQQYEENEHLALFRRSLSSQLSIPGLDVDEEEEFEESEDDDHDQYEEEEDINTSKNYAKSNQRYSHPLTNDFADDSSDMDDNDDDQPMIRRRRRRSSATNND